MNTHKVFIMIKPDGVARNLVGKIINRFEKRGFKLNKMRMFFPKREIFEKHYSEHEGKAFYANLISFSLSGPIIAMIWDGDIQVARKIVGSTAPWSAEYGTIRSDYSCTLPQNLIHCSDSLMTAQAEVALWENLL